MAPSDARFVLDFPVEACDAHFVLDCPGAPCDAQEALVALRRVLFALVVVCGGLEGLRFSGGEKRRHEAGRREGVRTGVLRASMAKGRLPSPSCSSAISFCSLAAVGKLRRAKGGRRVGGTRAVHGVERPACRSVRRQRAPVVRGRGWGGRGGPHRPRSM